LTLLTEMAASGDSDSQDHAVEALQGFYSPGAMRASRTAVPLGNVMKEGFPARRR
jgi:hypothetical protein